MSDFKYLLFDLDGTVFDTSAVEKEALKDLFLENCLPYSEYVLKLYTQINEELWKEFEKEVLTKSQVRLKRFEILFSKLLLCDKVNIKEFADRYFEKFSTTPILFKGASETINKIKNKYKIFVVSNGCVDIQMYKLKKLGMENTFEQVFLSEEIGHAKPAFEFFEYVHNALGRPNKDTVLVIGDSKSADIDGGNNFGYKTCYVGNEQIDDADFCIKSITEIEKIIKR